MMQNKLSFHQTSVSLEITGLPDNSNNPLPIFLDTSVKALNPDLATSTPLCTIFLAP